MNVSNDDNAINNLNYGVVFLNKYLLFTFCILGNIGNFISLFIFWKKSWKKNVCVVYFKVCLIINTCYLNSTIISAIINFGFHIYLQHSNIIICKILFYNSFLLSTLPPTILILASIDRLLISSQNIDTRLYSSKRLAYFSITISILFWILFHIHALIQMNIYEISPSQFICSFNYPIFYSNFVTYSLGVFQFGSVLSMIIFCILSFKNVRHIRVFPSRQNRTLHSMTKKDFQLLRCLYIQDMIYILSSLCVIIYYIYATLTLNQIRTSFQLAILNFVDKFVTFIYNISYSTNFFVFIFISKGFRHECKRISYKLFGKQIQILREDRENQPAIIEVNPVIVSTIVLNN